MHADVGPKVFLYQASGKCGSGREQMVFPVIKCEREDDLSEMGNDQQHKIDEVLRHVRELPIVAEVLKMLRDGLSSTLHYHCIQHTEKVMEEAILFAVSDGLSQREIELLGVAAAFHDAGFLKQKFENEAIGADMAAQAMERSGDFTPEEIQLVRSMILDTRLVDIGTGPVQVPNSKLSRYLLDADLANLGRDDFFQKLEQLRQENNIAPGHELEGSFVLVSNHRWYTPAAKNLRQAKKDENVAALKSRMGRPH